MKWLDLMVSWRFLHWVLSYGVINQNEVEELKLFSAYPGDFFHFDIPVSVVVLHIYVLVLPDLRSICLKT